jgi:hypothetical protein
VRHSLFKGKKEAPKIRENQDYHKPLRVAAEHGVNKTWASNCRITFLREQIAINAGIMNNGRINERSIKTAQLWNREMRDEIAYLERKKLFILQDPSKLLRLTEDQIRVAKFHPIENLIEFRNGKAIAWCHNDKNPSLTLWRQGNRAKCWVCDKAWSPIDVLMKRDGMGFVEAVMMLQ